MDFDRHAHVLEEALPLHLLDQLQALTQLQLRAENIGAHLFALKQQITRDLLGLKPDAGSAVRAPSAETILVVEDHRVARAIARELLEGLSYHVLFMDAQMRDADKGSRVDGILLDVPFLNAGHLARVRLAKQWSDRVVVSTLLPEGPARTYLREAGAVAFVSKPLRPDELGRRLREAIGAG